MTFSEEFKQHVFRPETLREKRWKIGIAMAATLLVSAYIYPAIGQNLRGLCYATDGDTLKCGQEDIRLVEYDTPEIYSPEKCATPQLTATVRQLGYAALGRVQFMIATNNFIIHRFRLPNGAIRKDRYGRTLARVTVSGEPLSEVLIRDGLAVPYDCPDFRCPKRISWCERIG